MTSARQGDRRVPAPPSVLDPFPAGPTQLAGGDPVPQLVREAAAPRYWSVRGLAAAVICIVLGGLVVMVGVQSMSKRVSVLAVARPVPVGAVITAEDVTTAQVSADPALSPIPDRDRAEVIGKVALAGLAPGTLLTRGEIGDADGFVKGQVLVALPLKPGQFPARGLSAGELVLIVATPGSGASAPAGPTSTTGTSAVVAEVGTADASTGVTVVDVRVPATAAVALAQLAATGDAAVLLLPVGS